MKPLRQICSLTGLAAAVVASLSACVSVPQVQEQIHRIDIGADSYIVRAGDTLESIAFRYKLSPNELAGLNPEVGRQLIPGTPLTIRAAANVRDSYRTESASTRQQQRDDQLAHHQNDSAVTSPVIRPRALPEQVAPVQRQHDEPTNRSVYTPAVNAVVSDVTLLDPKQPYDGAASQQYQPQYQPQGQNQHTEQGSYRNQQPANGQWSQQTPATLTQNPARQVPGSSAATQQLAYAGREIIEEEYTGGQALPGQQVTAARPGAFVAPANVPDSGRSNLAEAAANGAWTWPTQGQVARGFAPIQEGRHGVDIAGVPGQPVVAVSDGVVAYSGRDPSGVGNLIIVRHDDSLLTAYSHTADLFVAENDTVSAGDPIATLGWNSRQESVLRFEVRRNGNSVNPMDFLSMR